MERGGDEAKLREVPPAAGLIFLALALGFYAWAIRAGWSHGLEDVHRWRQSQTALSAYYLVGQPFALAYETPIYGPPWSAPLEFPLMQCLVARAVTLTGWTLESAGRAVSVAMHLATLFPAWLILGSLRVGAGARCVALGLWLLCPFYLFWSRTFMIESTALCAAVAYFACCLRVRGRGAVGWLVSATALGALAAMIKVTTFAAFAVAGVCAVIVVALREERLRLGRLARELAAIGGVPLVALLWWTHFSDGIKGANPMTQGLVSGALRQWNFGTLAQRFSIETWHIVLSRIPQLFAPITPWVCWPVLGALLFFASRFGTRAHAIGAAAVLFFVPPLVFTNLHWVHDYYLYSSGVFLVAAAVLSVVSFLEHSRLWCVGWAVALVLAAGSVTEYLAQFRPIQFLARTDARQIAEQIREKTTPNAVNIIVAKSGDPALAYYSERRALLLAGDVADDALREALQRLREYEIGGIFLEPGHLFPIEKLTALLREQGREGVAVHLLREE